MGEPKIDRELLERTSLASAYDGWQTALVVVAIVGAVLVAIGAYATYQTSYRIPKLAAERSERLDADTVRDQPVSAWSTRLLLKHHWVDQKIEGPLTVLVERPAVPQAGTSTSILIRRGEQTMAWARAVPFGEQYIWPYAQRADYLEDGDKRTAIEKIVPGAGIADFNRETGNYPVDIIGVGLESSSGGDPSDVYRQLSDDRGANLVEAVSSVVTVVSPQKEIHYRTIGLGRSLTSAEKGSAEEKRQRSALVIVIARLSQDTINLPEVDALVTLLMKVKLTTIDLSNYEYSAVAGRRLSPSLEFGDSKAPPWSAPKITVQEALGQKK